MLSLQDLYLPLGLFLGSTVVAGTFDNHFWRLLVLVAHHYASAAITLPSYMAWAAYIATAASIWWIPMWANLRYLQRQGCIFITGCDSGMGQATVIYLAQSQRPENNYEQIFAGCLNTKASQEYFQKHLTLEQQKYVHVIELDVSQDASVKAASQKIQEWIALKKTQLTGLCMYHGIAYTGPAEYLPLDIYERTLQVNFLGFVRVVQYLLPLLKQAKQARIILTGTGGGPTSPFPALLTAYAASKFATEAYCQCLRQELYMTRCNIEAVMINPGFVKPTLLMEEGLKLALKMWQACETKWGSTMAKDQYGKMLDHFILNATLQPGTPVQEVCKAAEHALLAPVPRSSYKVGIDSKLAPIVGMMPTGMRETITRHGVFGMLSPAKYVQGYRV